jgi:hypothetical protein
MDTIENLEFKLSLSASEWHEIKTAFPENQVFVEEGDVVNLNYKLICEYFDNTQKRLEAILRMQTLVKFDVVCLQKTKSTILAIGKLLAAFEDANPEGIAHATA